MPFDTYVWKIASRCNLNCTYCYVYNLGDESWRQQPRLMSEEVARTAAVRIRDHAVQHGLDRVDINFHGGEPFLGGRRHLELIHSAITESFAGSGVAVSTAAQTNALLFEPAIGDLLIERGIALYVSLDGPPEINDRYRLDLRGQPTGARVAEKLKEISAPPYDRIFAGILCVVDPTSDPRAVVDYLATFRPPMVDFLLPLNNHDNPPVRGVDEYADWLRACYDHVMSLAEPMRVRIFDDIMLALLGHGAGDSDRQYLVMETDGTLELDDTLKTAFDGASKLGYDIARDDLDVVAADQRLLPLRAEIARLGPTCRACALVKVCRGGHVSHRYSESQGLDNPSVYCSALQRLILHIRSRLLAEVAAAGSRPAGQSAG
ncbi:radical SAM protein [Micromonospora sp. SD12]|uniref:radical SAM protein n=1 Tax=Micromonospora sp. SD12 TaxID=3452216 RepID=UPI003F89393D